MIYSYLRVVIRILLRFKVYSIINVTGLAIGLACSILILLYVADEMRYDRFHEKANRIYRVGEVGNLGDRRFKEATAPGPLACVLLNEFPEVMQATRIMKGINTVISYKNKSFFETNYLYVDSTFFNVFSFPLVSGNPKTALTKPFTMVITESVAVRYFGEEDPMGKILHEADGNDFVITGIVKNPPENSHFHFDFLASMNSLWESKTESWLTDGFYTYIVLREGFPPDKFEQKLPDFTSRKMGPQILQYFGISLDEWSSSENDINFYIESLTRIYLFSDASNQLEPTSEVRYIYFFITIAFLIVILAAINFTSLTTAKSSIRAREVGIRKVMGSSRNRIIYQLLTESVFLSFLALIVSLAVVELFLLF
jgi:putative ABC transport system permease protein